MIKNNKELLLLIFSCCIINLAAIGQGTSTISFTATNGVAINKNIYGHFAEHLGRCIYDGFWKNGKIRMDIVAALQKIKVPV